MGDAGHGQQVAIVGGIGAEDVPVAQDCGDGDVDDARLVPVGWEDLAGGAPVGGVHQVEADEGDDEEGDTPKHGEVFPQGG